MVAGRERSDPARFFQMTTNGTIDRSAAFPLAGGSALRDHGTLALTASGALWCHTAVAEACSVVMRLVRRRTDEPFEPAHYHPRCLAPLSGREAP